jgi:hypothetical protein
LIWLVPALNVKFVTKRAPNEPVLLAVIVKVEEPSVKVLALTPLILKLNVVNEKLPVSTVPSAKVKVSLIVNALPKVHAPPTPLKNADPSETLLVVTVLPVVVDENVIVAVELHTVPATSDMEPRTFNVGDVPVANVTVPADTVMSRQAKAPVMVTV